MPKSFERIGRRTIRVTEKGLNIVYQHLAKFDEFAPNLKMIERLKQAVLFGEKISGADANFYLHEIAEATKMKSLSGQVFSDAYTVAHKYAIEKYGVSEFGLYHYDVIENFKEMFSRGYFNFWEIK
jgi:hypothetical protein